MAIIKRKPKTPAQRFLELSKHEVDNKRPEASLVESIQRAKGRNCYGRITSRRRGGGHKKLYRRIDFKRDILDIPAVVEAIEYDPFRSAYIALLKYENGVKKYIIAPNGLKKGDTVLSTNQKQSEFPIGLSMPLRALPPAIRIHAIEMLPGGGAKLARGAGVGAQLVSIDISAGSATIKMPSGEIRTLSCECRATVGVVGNSEHSNQSLGKAGRRRWLGRRPRVRGVAMNPVDHPMGGGEGKTSGGGHPVSPWGQLSKGYPTRRKSKPSNSSILVRRNGKKFKRS